MEPIPWPSLEFGRCPVRSWGVRNVAARPGAAGQSARQTIGIERYEQRCCDLKELFSDPAIAAQARFRCSTEGPDEFDVLFESILDDQFGYDPNSEYKKWVRHLYGLGDFQNSE
jgi:hypothetical protein